MLAREGCHPPSPSPAAQASAEADAPDGFWLLKDFETVGRG